MEVLRNAFERAVNYMSTIGISDLIDILIVAFLIYRVVGFVRKTNSHYIARGLLLFVIALWLSGIFKLTMLNYALRRAAELGLIALLVLFQPELRRLLEKAGAKLSSGKSSSSAPVETAIMQTVLACNDLSQSKTGALIVFERTVSINDVVNTGTVINSDVNSELIKNLFFNKAPLHDGALVIRNNRIVSAGCVLPLTKNTNLSKDLGMRHRAGLGMSEHSDAVVVIVSEETGAISVAIDGMLKRHLESSTLDALLHKELVIEENETENSFMKLMKKLSPGKKSDAEKKQ